MTIFSSRCERYGCIFRAWESDGSKVTCERCVWCGRIDLQTVVRQSETTVTSARKIERKFREMQTEYNARSELRQNVKGNA